MPVMITLKQIQDKKPCKEGWDKVLASRGENPDYNEEFPLANCIDSNGYDQTKWAMRCLDTVASKLVAANCFNALKPLAAYDATMLAALTLTEAALLGDATLEMMTEFYASNGVAMRDTEKTALAENTVFFLEWVYSKQAGSANKAANITDEERTAELAEWRTSYTKIFVYRVVRRLWDAVYQHKVDNQKLTNFNFRVSKFRVLLVNSVIEFLSSELCVPGDTADLTRPDVCTMARLQTAARIEALRQILS